VGPGGAQQAPVSLLADRVSYDEASATLTVEGNVEVLYEGRVLRASRLIYDERADEIRAAGPIVLTDPEGGVLLAEAAALTPDLEAGLVQGARVLIADRLQLAAAEARRTEGRFVTLDRVVASTCTICAGEPTPTWAIRAARVTQDPVAERIDFEDARLEVFGLPVAYAPRLSIPDPAWSGRRASSRPSS
jgi:LPS-assembly protein